MRSRPPLFLSITKIPTPTVPNVSAGGLTAGDFRRAVEASPWDRDHHDPRRNHRNANPVMGRIRERAGSLLGSRLADSVALRPADGRGRVGDAPAEPDVSQHGTDPGRCRQEAEERRDRHDDCRRRPRTFTTKCSIGLEIGGTNAVLTTPPMTSGLLVGNTSIPCSPRHPQVRSLGLALGGGFSRCLGGERRGPTRHALPDG